MSNLIIKKTRNTNGTFTISFQHGFDLISSSQSEAGETLENFESRIQSDMMETLSEYVSFGRNTQIIVEDNTGAEIAPDLERLETIRVFFNDHFETSFDETVNLTASWFETSIDEVHQAVANRHTPHFTKEDREVKMYGMTVADMKADFEQWNLADDPSQMLMRAMGILSDVQEGVSRGSMNDEDLRQALNRSKFFISETKRQIPREGFKQVSEVPDRSERGFTNELEAEVLGSMLVDSDEDEDQEDYFCPVCRRTADNPDHCSNRKCNER